MCLYKLKKKKTLTFEISKLHKTCKKNLFIIKLSIQTSQTDR